MGPTASSWESESNGQEEDGLTGALSLGDEVPGVVVAVKTGCHFAGWECSNGSQIKTQGVFL